MAYALVQQTINSSGSTNLTTLTATLTGTTLGNLFTIGVNCYLDSALITVTSDNGTNCNQAINAAVRDAILDVAIWYGINAASGSITFTAHYAAPNGGSFPTIHVQEWSGSSGVDVGVGNNNNESGVTTATISTNGVTTQTNQLIYSMQNPNTTEPNSVGSNQTPFDQNISSYQLVDSSGATVTHTYGYSGSNNVLSVIAVFGVAATDTLMGAMVM